VVKRVPLNRRYNVPAATVKKTQTIPDSAAHQMGLGSSRAVNTRGTMVAFNRVRRFVLTSVLLSLVLAGAGFTWNPTSADSAALGAGTPPRPPGVTKPTPTVPRTRKWPGPFAVVLVVDAARYDEFNLAQMPNLAKLAASGVQYSQAWVGQLPSVTEASHATIGTGVLPTRHNILGDTWRVPGTEQMSPNLLNSQLTRTGYIYQADRLTQSGRYYAPPMARLESCCSERP
jgi:hypothetical protein